MATNRLESRIVALEREVARLKIRLLEKSTGSWRDIIGTFANDPMYLEAMKLGRKYRESTRPKKRKGKNGRS